MFRVNAMFFPRKTRQCESIQYVYVYSALPDMSDRASQSARARKIDGSGQQKEKEASNPIQIRYVQMK